jgi:hypothetical protein
MPLPPHTQTHTSTVTLPISISFSLSFTAHKVRFVRLLFVTVDSFFADTFKSICQHKNELWHTADRFSSLFRLSTNYRDPMESMLLEQHLRSPMRMFPDPIMAQLAAQAPESPAALIEKARQQLQLWGRTPYAEMLLPQLYQQYSNLSALNLMQNGQWPPQIPAAFLQNALPSTSTTTATPNSSQTSAAKQFQRFTPYQIPQPHQQQHPSARNPPNI